MGGLSLFFFLNSLLLSGRGKVQHGRWVMPAGPSVTCHHACASVLKRHHTRFHTHTQTNSFNDILTTYVARRESKFITKREVQAMLVNHQQKVQKCYFQLVTQGKTKGSEGLFLMNLCKCSLQPYCHSRSAKWITLKVREKCLVRLSNSSSPKPICLPVTVALGD